MTKAMNHEFNDVKVDVILFVSAKPCRMALQTGNIKSAPPLSGCSVRMTITRMKLSLTRPEGLK